jgi:outer membrane protein
MIRRPFVIALLLAWPAGLAAAQPRLTLADAVARARAGNADVRIATAAEREAQAGVALARAGYLPSVEISEGWQRSNHPVFVFSSLLAQRQFGAADFAIDALNRPDAMPNLRAAVSVEQAVFDLATVAGMRAAALSRDLAATSRAVVAQDLAVAVTSAYGAVLAAEAATRAADGAVVAAEADRTRARRRHDAGMVTLADVLQIEVALARAQEQRIRSAAEATIARAKLNQVMGEPLETAFVLDDTPPDRLADVADRAALETAALEARPEMTRSALQEQLAQAVVAQAKAAFMPRVVVQGGWEANGDGWGSRASSWSTGIVARMPIFRGGADQARLGQARQAAVARGIERERLADAVRLDVRIATARVEAARAAGAVSHAAVAQARESQRIIRDRYDAGLADVTALLRAAEAVQQAEARQWASDVDITMAAAMLARALGRS